MIPEIIEILKEINQSLINITKELCKMNKREDNKYDDGYCEQIHDHK